MKTCKEIIKKATETGEYKPQLQLFTKAEGGGTQPTGAHKVKLISSKIVKGTDFKTKAERFEVELTLEEEGANKTYNFPVKNKQGGVHYLVERFAELKEGTEVVLTGKKAGKTSYIDVSVVGSRDDALEQDPNDIPIIEEDEIAIEDSSTKEDAPDITEEDEIPF